MDGQAIGAGALASAGPRWLAGEIDGPLPGNVGALTRVRPAGEERVSDARNEARVLRPVQP